MITYELQFLHALIVTISVETLTLLLLLRFVLKHHEVKTGNGIIAGFIASALTLPYFWFILPAFITDFLTYAIIGEICIWLIEGFFYYAFLRIPLWKCILLSLLCNAASIGAGEMIKIIW
ncbi:MAG: hypothetical protein ACK4NC_05645 [Candidatus Gracilibacteria bacterium]